jgi:hypothetical protein
VIDLSPPSPAQYLSCSGVAGNPSMIVSSEYIAHLIQARGRPLPQPSALVLMRRQDVLELDLPPADLSLYAIPGAEGDSQ